MASRFVHLEEDLWTSRENVVRCYAISYQMQLDVMLFLIRCGCENLE